MIGRIVVAVLMMGIVAGCASISGTAQPKSNDSTLTDQSEQNLGVLLSLSRTAYQTAKKDGDARAMARALADRPLVEDGEAGDIWQDVTRRLWDETFALAAADPGALADVEEIFKRAHNSEGPLGGFSGSFGKLLGKPVTGGEARSVDLAPGGSAEFRQVVSPSKGMIVYVEAPQLHGVSLKIVDQDERVLDEDKSGHGFLICRWRPSERTKIRIILENPGRLPAHILLVTNQ